MWKTIFQSNEWPKNTREFTKTYYRGSMPGESRKRPNSSSWRRPAELGLIVDHSKVILIEQWPALPPAPMQVSSLSGFISSIAVSYSFCRFVSSNGLPPQEYTEY